jgi:phospholipid/cholesterol/gamma-HCH transport system substrate-binding protein
MPEPGERSRNLAIGAFATLALLVLAIGIMAVGGEHGVLSGQAKYRVMFPATQGLIVGSPVHMSGVQIGSVSGIRLPTDPRAPGIQVELTVDDSYARRIRTGSSASLRFLAILSGEKYVDVTPGDPATPVLQEGSVIPSAAPSEILAQGEDIAENLTEITGSLVDILEPLRNGQGLLGQMIHNPEFGRESLEHVNQTLANVEALSKQARSGQGFVGRLLTDPALAAKADRLGQAVDDVAEVTSRLRAQEGALGELTREGAAGQQAIQDLRAGAASLRATVERIERGEGLAGKVVGDEEYARRNAEAFARSIANVEAITERVLRGEGTLGKLVADPTLYDEATTVVGGVNDSKFARWLLRRFRKKGIEAKEEAQREPQAPPQPAPPPP